MISQIPSTEQPGLYPLPWPLLARISWAALTGQRRSIARDARAAMVGLTIQPLIAGGEWIPPTGPCLVACNHYTRPGLDAWWLALAISATVAAHRATDADPDIRWVMTAAWTFRESRIKHRTLTPLTRWAFARAAQVYGFVPMPPMPPTPGRSRRAPWRCARRWRWLAVQPRREAWLDWRPKARTSPHLSSPRRQVSSPRSASRPKARASSWHCWCRPGSLSCRSA